MVDVTIRGAGIFGLSIAWLCIQRGATVQVIDPFGPGAGASGGILGALAPHVPENWNAKKAFQLDSLLAAGAFWAGVDAASGLSSGYARSGRLQPLADLRQVDLARARSRTAAELWRGEADWRVKEAPARFAPLSPTGLVVHDTLTARLHPRQAIASLAGAVRARGGAILREGRDRGQVVHATGVADLGRISDALGKAVGAPIKGQAALLDHDARDCPQIFADGVHIVPHGDGTTAVGSTTEREFADPVGTDAQLDMLIAKARHLVPALARAPVLSRWAGLRPRTRSRAPMLGAHPLHAGQFIANGGFKIGFGMATGVAGVMADLILEGRDRIPADFRPEVSL